MTNSNGSRSNRHQFQLSSPVGPISIIEKLPPRLSRATAIKQVRTLRSEEIGELEKRNRQVWFEQQNFRTLYWPVGETVTLPDCPELKTVDGIYRAYCYARNHLEVVYDNVRREYMASQGRND